MNGIPKNPDDTWPEAMDFEALSKTEPTPPPSQRFRTYSAEELEAMPIPPFPPIAKLTPKPPLVAPRCDRCGKRADAIHVLRIGRDDQRVELSCPKHDAGGYWFPLKDWFATKNYTMRHHLADKYDGGGKTIELIDKRLGVTEYKE